MQRLIGLEAKLEQYEQGERFIEAVERAGGPALLDRVLGGPREPARRSPRSATRAALDRRGCRASRRAAVTCSARCRFPRRAAAVTCAVSGGADSLALLVLAGRAGL